MPLRAQIGQLFGGAAASDEALQLSDQSLGQAYRSYEQAMLRQPWLGAWPLCIRGARVRRQGSQLFLCDSDESAAPLALALLPGQFSLASPLLGLAKMDAIGLWDGYYLTLCWAQTELGRWVNA
jgi:hypothetical protein